MSAKYAAGGLSVGGGIVAKILGRPFGAKMSPPKVAEDAQQEQQSLARKQRQSRIAAFGSVEGGVGA